MLRHMNVMSVPSLLSFFSNKLSNPSCLGLSTKVLMAYILQPKLEQREVVLPSGSYSFFNFVFSTSQLFPPSITELGVHRCTSHSCSNIQANESKTYWVHRLTPWSAWFIWKVLIWSSKTWLHFRDRLSSPCILALKPHSLLRTMH